MNRHRTMTALIAGVFALSAAGAAVADEDDGESTEQSTDTVVTTVWDDESRVLVVSIDDEGAEDGACETVTVERDEEGNVVVMVDEAEVSETNQLPEGCTVYDGEGPNGQVNHGTIVSSVARNLSPHDIDGPKGQIMREVAKISKDDVTKVKPDNGDDDGEEGAEPEAKESTLDRGNGKGKGRSK